MQWKAGYVGNQGKKRYPLKNVAITNSKSEIFLILALYDAFSRCPSWKSHSTQLSKACAKNKKAETTLVGNARPSWDLAVCKLV
jgi:hypothetical protein